MARGRVAHLELDAKNTVVRNATLNLIDFDVAQLDRKPKTLDRRDHRHKHADFLGTHYACVCGAPQHISRFAIRDFLAFLD
jgi:hypothetical protein